MLLSLGEGNQQTNQGHHQGKQAREVKRGPGRLAGVWYHQQHERNADEARHDIDVEHHASALALLSPTPLYEQTFAFARTHGLSNVYDSVYVVLAQFLNTTLWTADETLLNVLGTAAPWVRFIGAYPLPLGTG